MLISVIIPTFNRPDMIAGSLKSVLEQTVTDLEIIVVDGSNNDATRRQVFMFNNERIKYLKIRNSSAAHSRNTGIKNATGDLVAFNDDDDLWCNNKIEKQLGFFKKDSYKRVVYSAFSKVTGKTLRKTPDKKVSRKRDHIYEEILQRNFVGLPTIMLPLSCCQEMMFDEQLQCLEDWDWTIRLSKKYSFDFIEESLVTVGDTPQSVNKSNYYIKAAAYKRIYDKHYSDIKLVPTREAKHLLSIGSNLCLAGDIKTGRNYLLRSLRIDSKNPKIIGGYLMSFMGSKAYRSGFKTFERLTNSQP